MKKIILSMVWLVVVTLNTQAQQSPSFRLDGSTNGTTITVACVGARLYDDGGAGSDYQRGHDCHVRLSGSCGDAQPGSVLILTIEELDVAQSDTLYIFDGDNERAPLLIKINNSYSSTDERTFAVSVSNTSKMLSLRFRTAFGSAPTGAGFRLNVEYRYPCDEMEVAVAQDYYELWGDDTIEHTLQRMDIAHGLRTAIGCYHGGMTEMLMTAECRRVNRYGYATSDGPNNYTWLTVQDGEEVSRISGMDSSHLCQNEPRTMQKLILYAEDMSNGCESNYDTIVLVNLDDPVKSICDLPTLWGYDSVMLSAGYGPGYSLFLKPTTERTASSGVGDSAEQRFVCAPGVGGYSVLLEREFNEFDEADTIAEVAQVASVCVGIEHSNMDDLSIAIACPSYQPQSDSDHGIAYLKHSNTGNENYLGVPCGGDDYAQYDFGCDSVRSLMGKTFHYCFSRNGNYQLWNHTPAHPSNESDTATTLCSENIGEYTANIVVEWDTIYPENSVKDTVTVVTTRESNDLARTGYYTPESDYTSLIGCPLNGIWKLIIFDDNASVDNGWVDYFGLELTAPFDDTRNYRYYGQADSVRWLPDTDYYRDFPGGGFYHGVEMLQVDDYSAMLYATNMTNNYRIRAQVYDQYGCRFDTVAHINTIADTTLYVEDFATNEMPLTLYPNPARGCVTVAINHFDGPTNLTVVDGMGRTLLRKAVTQSSTMLLLPIDQFARGVYYIQVGKGKPKKLIIQ